METATVSGKLQKDKYVEFRMGQSVTLIEEKMLLLTLKNTRLPQLAAFTEFFCPLAPFWVESDFEKYGSNKLILTTVRKQTPVLFLLRSSSDNVSVTEGSYTLRKQRK